MDCVFCKIVSGEIPAYRVYEDESTLIFLDIHPTTKGHVLVIPKVHVRDLQEASSTQVSAVMHAIQKIAPALVAATGAEGFNVIMNTGGVAGQVVFHWHTHVIPRFRGDGLTPWPGQAYPAGEAETLARNIQKNLL